MTQDHLAYLLRRNAAFFWVSALYAVATGIALAAGVVFSDVIVTSGIYFILVMGLDILYGYAGLLSLGHIGFFAIGAYAVGILVKQAALGFCTGAAIALAINATLGLLLGGVFLRLRGSQFMLGTLAFGLVVHAVLTVWYSVTGGDAGLVGVPRPTMFGTPLDSDLKFGALVWAVAAALAWLAMNLTRSRVGRALLAVRSDEVSAAALGIRVGRLKTRMFAVSAAYASIAGSLFASYTGTLHPDSFNMSSLLNVLLMMFLGGEGTIWGGLIGATLLQLLPDMSAALHNAKILFSGILFSVIIFVFPDGIAGGIRRFLPRRAAEPADPSPQPLSGRPLARAGSSSPVLLAAEGATRSFGGLMAINGATVEVEKGRIGGLIGPTLLQLLSDMSAALHNAKTLFSGILFSAISFFFPDGIAGGIRHFLVRRDAGSAGSPSQPLSGRPVAGVNTSDPVLLAVEEVTRSFGGLVAVNGVTVEVEKGRIRGLIGPNGAGKSTLLDLVSGALPSHQGRIRFAGRDLAGLRPDQIARLGLQRTFQHERLFTKMMVTENVMVGCELGSDGSVGDLLCCALALPHTLAEEQRARGEALAWLDHFGLIDRADAAVGDLPHGLRKMVEVARAVAARPTLLLLDETAAGLNEAEKARFKKLVRGFRDCGMTIMMIEHDIDFVMSMSDVVAVMDFGQKIADGPPAAILKDEAVVSAYLGA